MKTLKFFFLFNLFFYTAIFTMIILASLFVYQIDIQSLSILLMKYYQIFPTIFVIVNASLVFIKAYEKIYEWLMNPSKRMNLSKRMNRIISRNELSFTNNFDVEFEDLKIIFSILEV
ncbi:MAG: hypothetical protein WCO13_12555 [Bacteroidota bacterium]